MHLDRGHLTWPQTRRDLAAAALQFTIRINSVILQNRPSYTIRICTYCTKCSCLYVYTSSGSDIILTTWHNVTSHHQTQLVRVSCQTSLSNYPLPFPQHQLPVIISCIIDIIDQWILETEYDIERVLTSGSEVLVHDRCCVLKILKFSLCCYHCRVSISVSLEVSSPPPPCYPAW